MSLTLDLNKAFDTVNHKILLHKLEHYGICGVCNNLLRNYLSNRIQTVSVSDTTSSVKPITCGVPQGSILGPLLSLIYINDIPNALLKKPRLYADDTCLIISSPTIEDLNSRFKAVLHDSQSWTNLNKLSLNINKTYSLLKSPRVCSHSADTSALLNTGKIQQVNEITYLGVEIDSQLNFKSHIDKTQSKIAKGIGNLFKLNKLLPQNALLTLPTPYGILIWGSTYKSHLQV